MNRACCHKGGRGRSRLARPARYFSIVAVTLVLATAWAPGALAAAPANDDFADASVIASLPFTGNVNMYDATGQLDDPVCPPSPANHTVWYSYTASGDARIDVTTSGSVGDYIPFACAYTGTEGALSAVTVTHQSDTDIRFDAVDGETYFVFVALVQQSANFSTVTVTEAPPPPSNDDFDNAAVIGALPYDDSVDTTEATAASDDPSGADETTVWYAFMPTHDIRLTASVAGTGFGYAPRVSVWTGARGALNSVTPRDPGPPLVFDAQAGTTYYFLVGNIYTTLGGQLDFSLDGVLEAGLGLATSRASVNYKRAVTVTAHLADFADLTNKTVFIYKTPYGGVKTLVKTAAVDSSGNVSAVVTLTKNTKFVAQWAGEDGWLAAQSPLKTVGVHVITTTKLSGFFGRSGAYKLYHAGDDPKITGTVVPNHAGKVLRFIAQIRRGGAWRALATANFRIRANGTSVGFLVNPRSGFAYRVKNVFIGDADHLGDASPLKYFRVS